MGDHADSRFREGLDTGEYARSDDGVLWDTYLGAETVVQCPPSEDDALYFTDLVPRAAFLFSHAAEHGVRVPAVVEHSSDAPAYLVLERIRGESLSSFVRAADPEGREAAARSAGEVLGQIHATPGFGHGSIEANAYTETSHDSWREFARALVTDAVEYTAGGPFEPVVAAVADSFEPAVVPEQPASRLLHGDFSADNVIIDRETRAWAIDLDNALYGDHRYDFVRARDRLTGADPREATYAELLGTRDGRVLSDADALAAFEAGYRERHAPEMDEDIETQYSLLAMAKSAQDGEWIRQNREISTADWVAGIERWYRERVGSTPG